MHSSTTEAVVGIAWRFWPLLHITWMMSSAAAVSMPSFVSAFHDVVLSSRGSKTICGTSIAQSPLHEISRHQHKQSANHSPLLQLLQMIKITATKTTTNTSARNPACNFLSCSYLSLSVVVWYCLSSRPVSRSRPSNPAFVL